MITNRESGTSVDEIESGIYRISTPIPPSAIGVPGGFSFNQILVVDEQPLLFHAGMKRLFPLVREAVATVIDPASLRFIGFSHTESDENGSLDEWLATAPGAEPLCGQIAGLLLEASRPARALADGEEVRLGKKVVRFIAAPHVPHGWDCGFLYESTTNTLLCGDLFTQPGTGETALTESDVLGPSEAMRQAMDYYAHAPGTKAALERMAALEPRTLACMHGSSFRGDGGKLLRALAASLTAQ